VLIRNAEVEGRRVDVRCAEGRILEVAARLAGRPGSEPELDAGGGALLPGLHDHHLHLLALAAALDSIDCGPPAVRTPDALRRRLTEASPDPTGWLRGRGYHDSVAGALDRYRLDALCADRPIRIQHRSGALWMLNSEALRRLGLGPTESLPEGLERDAAGRPTGRLFRLDGWLRSRLPSRPEPVLTTVGRELTQFGVTGVTDATPTNGPEEQALFEAAQRRGELPQRILLMGGLDLRAPAASSRLEIGARKRLLDEPSLPDLEELVRWIEDAHALGRAVAFHAVTRVELQFALAALEEAGSRPGDRIEHASVAPDDTLDRIRQLGLTIVTQPGFVAERGDAYRREVDPRDLGLLYRVRTWLTAGVALGGGTDAPFGAPDPWRAMRAAIERRTADGEVLGADERVTPERALALFTTAPCRPGGPRRCVRAGETADLCLLDLPWAEARHQLACERVRATFIAGERIDGDGIPSDPTSRSELPIEARNPVSRPPSCQ
jgi:predicted amidohydrolase YtcJ